jgi:putative ABC transport system permease protein
VESAASELEATVAKWEEMNPGTHNPDPERHPMFMRSLQEQVVGDVREALFLLLGAVGFVLLIACANVANLLLARGEDRQREVAVRVAMGAGRARLIGQFLVEGVVLSVTGGLVGLGLAWLSLRGLRIVGSADLPRLREITLDARVLLVTATVAVLTGILFGLAPARHAVRSSATGGKLRDGDSRSTGGWGRTRLRSLLVVSEVALAMMLAVGAGLMIRSFQQLTSVDPGFDARGVLTFQVYLPTARYGEEADVMAFHRRMEEELAAIPGVTNVAAMVGLPPLRDLDANDTDFEHIETGDDGLPVNGAPNENVDFYQAVTPGYLDAMKIPVLRGRGFAASDTRASAPVALVNETLERVFYPGQSAVGKRLRTCCGDDAPWIEIVGVLADVKQAGLDAQAGTELYFTLDQVAPLWYLPRSMNVVVRTASDPEAIAPAVRQTMSRLDASLPLAGLRSMERVLAGARARPRFLTSVLLGFALLALALAAVGTYGVMSYSVAQRSREVGIRMALGAERGTVLKLVLRQGMVVTGAGIALGTVGAFVLSGALQRLLFEVAPRDWITFAVVPLLLGLTSIVALWIPAHRATRVNPVKVLRDG